MTFIVAVCTAALLGCSDKQQPSKRVQPTVASTTSTPLSTHASRVSTTMPVTTNQLVTESATPQYISTTQVTGTNSPSTTEADPSAGTLRLTTEEVSTTASDNETTRSTPNASTEAYEALRAGVQHLDKADEYAQRLGLDAKSLGMNVDVPVKELARKWPEMSSFLHRLDHYSASDIEEILASGDIRVSLKRLRLVEAKRMCLEVSDHATPLLDTVKLARAIERLASPEPLIVESLVPRYNAIFASVETVTRELLYKALSAAIRAETVADEGIKTAIFQKLQDALGSLEADASHLTNLVDTIDTAVIAYISQTRKSAVDSN